MESNRRRRRGRGRARIWTRPAWNRASTISGSFFQDYSYQDQRTLHPNGRPLRPIFRRRSAAGTASLRIRPSPLTGSERDYDYKFHTTPAGKNQQAPFAQPAFRIRIRQRHPRSQCPRFAADHDVAGIRILKNETGKKTDTDPCGHKSEAKIWQFGDRKLDCNVVGISLFSRYLSADFQAPIAWFQLR